MDFFTKMNDILFEQIDGKWVITTNSTFMESDYDALKNMPECELLTCLRLCGMLHDNHICDTCGTLLQNACINNDRHEFFRCGKRACSRKKHYLCKNTIFDGSKLTKSYVIRILYFFSCRRTVADASECLGISKPTVVSFYKLFRSSIFCFMETYSTKLGGMGVVIHFDETPMTRRHGGTGNHARSNTVWVVGGVDIFSRKCFLKFLPSRSRNDLFHFLNEWILPGSIVHTDCHRSYMTLSSLGFQHFTVNHSRNLVGPDGTHTNWIEGLFGCMKKMRRKYDAGFTDVFNLELYLAEFCFRYSFDVWDRKSSFIKLSFMLKKVKEILSE